MLQKTKMKIKERKARAHAERDEKQIYALNHWKNTVCFFFFFSVKQISNHRSFPDFFAFVFSSVSWVSTAEPEQRAATHICPLCSACRRPPPSVCIINTHAPPHTHTQTRTFTPQRARTHAHRPIEHSCERKH